MSEKKIVVQSGGFGIATIIFLILMTLKLAGIGSVAGWSWLWVTSPIWGVFALAVAFLAAFVPVAMLLDWIKLRRIRKSRR